MEDEHCDDCTEHNHSNPLDSLDKETQDKIQELQMMEESFQQLLMQKNAFSMESNETEYVIKEVEKTSSEIFRIVGNQVIIKSTKEEILENMSNKKKLLETRMKSINEQEQEFSAKIKGIREEVMEKIQK